MREFRSGTRQKARALHDSLMHAPHSPRRRLGVGYTYLSRHRSVQILLTFHIERSSFPPSPQLVNARHKFQ